MQPTPSVIFIMLINSMSTSTNVADADWYSKLDFHEHELILKRVIPDDTKITSFWSKHNRGWSHISEQGGSAGRAKHPCFTICQISSTPPRTVVECGVEYLEPRGGVGWSISGSRFSDTPPRTVVECGVEYLDRRGGVGWSFHLVLK